MSDTPNTPDSDKNIQAQAAYPVTDRVREAMAVSLRGCDELIPEADWVKKLDGFLTLNDRDILDNAGKISHDMAKQHAETQYELFHQQRQQLDTANADKRLADLSQLAHQLSDKTRKND